MDQMTFDNLVTRIANLSEEKGYEKSRNESNLERIRQLEQQVADLKNQEARAYTPVSKLEPLLRCFAGYSYRPGCSGKIGAIKAIRELTGMGLKEAKDLVEACVPPAPTE